MMKSADSANRLLALEGRMDALGRVLAYQIAPTLKYAADQDRGVLMDALVNLLQDGPYDGETARTAGFRQMLEAVADEALRRAGPPPNAV